MGDLYLIYFVPENVNTSDLYNPSSIPGFRANVDSELGRKLNAENNDVVLIKKVGVGKFEIIRRAKYPYSHNQFIALISNNTGTGGEGTENNVISIGEDEIFTPGTPIGLGIGNNLSTWILVALALLIIINNK